MNPLAYYNAIGIVIWVVINLSGEPDTRLRVEAEKVYPEAGKYIAFAVSWFTYAFLWPYVLYRAYTDKS